MDTLSIVGVALALGAILGGQWLEGGALGSLLQVAAFLIVVGGTLGAVMLQSPLATFLQGMRLSRWVFTPPVIDHDGAIQSIVRWADAARKEGVLSLENQVETVSDDFTRNGLQMLVDGFEPDKIRDALEIEISAYDERQRTAARVWEAAGGYAPTVGIIGAVLGLIHVMENLSDPSKLGGGIATAFVATVYGVGIANLIFLPLANKLKRKLAIERERKTLIAEGVLSIQAGLNPRVLEEKLAA